MHQVNITNQFKSLSGKPPVLVQCVECHEPFIVHVSQKPEKRKFCSEECKFAGARRRNAVKCLQCGIVFQGNASRIRQGYAKFCSRTCRWICHASKRPRRIDKRLVRQIDIQMTTQSRIAVAWAIAGEGTIGVRLSGPKTRRCFVPVVSCCNSSKAFIDRFCEAAGCGRVYFVDEKRYGHPGRKDIYLWTLSRTIEVKSFLEQILPFLPIKQRQAELVIELCGMKISGAIDSKRWRNQFQPGNRDIARETAIYDELKRLNKRGRPILV